MRTVASAVVCLLVAGCVGTQALATAPQTPAVTQSPVIIYVTPSPAPSGIATPEPTDAPGPTQGPASPAPTATPAPTGTSAAVQGDPVLLTWRSDGYTTAQILLPVTNSSGTWIQLSDFDSDYTIYAPDGSVQLTGSFDFAAPKLLAPGATGYLVGEEFGDDFTPEDLGRVEASGRFKDAREPASELAVDNTRVRSGEFSGIEVTGEVSNPGSEAIDSVEIVAIFFDANGALLGYARDYVDNLDPGAHKGFTADSDFAEIKLAEIANTLIFASDGSLF